MITTSKRIYKLILIILLLGCDGNPFGGGNDSLENSTNNLDIYDVWKQNTPLEKDSNGYYYFEYAPTGMSDSDYGTVKYTTEVPITRVFWASPDSFFVYYMDQWFGDPIINYSTYSGSDGYGQQLFYIYESHIGDTLSIYGSISDNIFDSVFVIIEDSSLI